MGSHMRKSTGSEYKSGQVIDDPYLLSQVGDNSPSQKSQSQYKSGDVISDPQLLSQVNNNGENYQKVFTSPKMFDTSSIESALKDKGLSVLAGLGNISQIFSQPGTLVRSLSNALVPDSDQKRFQNLNIPSELNVPNTFSNKLTTGLVSSIPQVALGLISGGSSALPEIASSLVGQSALGAASAEPGHRTEGAIMGGLGGLLSEIMPFLNTKTADSVARDSMDKLVPYAKGIYNESQKGYDVLDKMGSQKIIDPHIPSPNDLFPNIYNAEDTVNYLKNVKVKSPANSDVLKETQDALKPDYKSVIESKFDPESLEAFKSLPDKGGAQIAYDKFIKNPTGKNAGELDRAWGRARTGINPDRDAIYTQLRDQLKDNIIMPGVKKFASSDDAELYGNAHLNYRKFKEMFGNSEDMENLAAGNIDKKDMNAQRLYNMMQPKKEAGAFNNIDTRTNLPYGLQTVPMQVYKNIQSKFVNPSTTQYLINKSPMAAKFLSPKLNLIKWGLLGSTNNKNQ